MTPAWPSQFWFPVVFTDEPIGQTNNIHIQEHEISRMDIIRNARRLQGLTTEESVYLEDFIGEGTAKAHDNGWKKWTKWYKREHVESSKYKIENIVRFLISQQHYSPQHLNTLRLALSSVFKHLHPNMPNIATNIRIQDLFAAKRRKHFKIPQPHELETWDTDK